MFVKVDSFTKKTLSSLVLFVSVVSWLLVSGYPLLFKLKWTVRKGPSRVVTSNAFRPFSGLRLTRQCSGIPLWMPRWTIRRGWDSRKQKTCQSNDKERNRCDSTPRSKRETELGMDNFVIISLFALEIDQFLGGGGALQNIRFFLFLNSLFHLYLTVSDRI